MILTTKTAHISYLLQEDVEMSESEDGVVVISPFFQVTISHLSPRLRSVMMTLAKTACSVRWMNESIIEAHGESMLVPFYRYLSCLLRHQMISICVGSADGNVSIATLIPISSYIQQNWVNIHADQSYRMSRFAYVRRDEDGFTYLESPLSHARIRLDHSMAASLIYQLGKAVTPFELTQTIPGGDEDTIMSLLALLVMGNFVSPTMGEGRLSEDDDEVLMHWDFHDLLFHSRSRAGRHNNMFGSTFRFLHQLPPQPAVKQTQWPVTIPLPQPDMDRICSSDSGLIAVMEARASICDYGDSPITVAQLGEFLYRVARV
jgi:oxazoline/thiazoline dehydrogenase